MTLVLTVGALSATADAKAASDGGGRGSGRPKPTTTTTTATAPRIATDLTVLPPVHAVRVGCGFDNCGYLEFPVVFSSRLTTAAGDPVVGRMVSMWNATARSCTGITNAEGLATCATYDYFSLDARARFEGDSVYAPTYENW